MATEPRPPAATASGERRMRHARLPPTEVVLAFWRRSPNDTPRPTRLIGYPPRRYG
jgi:hypothetical protein